MSVSCGGLAVVVCLMKQKHVMGEMVQCYIEELDVDGACC